MLELNLIKEFVLLSEVCNYARAAEDLFISQSTLSKHIMALEKQLGHPLFYRSTRRVTLTEFGVGFLPYAHSLMEAMNECESFIAANNDVNTVTIGALQSLYLYPTLSECFSNFSRQYPEIKLNVIQNHYSNLVKQLRSHECDFIIVREITGTEVENCSHITVLSEPLCIALPASHPLANEAELPLTSVANENFILPAEGSNLNPVFLKECYDAGFTPTINYKLSSKEYTFQLVEQNKGCAILGKSVANHYATPNIRVIPLMTFANENINITYTKLSQLSASSKKFLQFVKDSLLTSSLKLGNESK